MKINKKLLPVKGHYFLFNAGTAPLVPYLSTYARQLGFSSATVGLIYTVLPIFGLVAKPLFGVIADRFKIQKSLFLIFQVVTIVSFSLIYVIPESANNIEIDLDCDDGVTVLRSCYNSADLVESCKVSLLGDQNATSICNMNCDMTSPKMWQTVCEHWSIPQFCFSNTDSIQYTTTVKSLAVEDDKCSYISTGNVTLDGYSYVPHCRIGRGFVDINQPCNMNCSETQWSTAINYQKVNMTCVDNTLHYRLCNSSSLDEVMKNAPNISCQAQCDLDIHSPWRLMEICEGWGADAAATCQPKTGLGDEFPSNLTFDGVIKLDTTISEHECVYVQLHEILLDGQTHYPRCLSQAQYQTEFELFHTSCNITCDNGLLNEVFSAASESRREDTTQFTQTFWLFFLLMIISWIGQAVVVSIADAICFNLLGDKPSAYGKQRLWGSVGWGIFSLLTGSLIDVFSGDGANKNYTIAFILMFVFMTGDVIVSCFVKNEPTRMSHNILADVSLLLSSLPTVIFFLWTIAVGLCTGLLWQFLFWHLEDISNLSCTGTDYIKTLQGLVSAIQMFGGEIPFMFISGYLLKKVGHVNMMSFVLLAFGVRFVLYSFLTNPWWVLPIEMFQGLTFGMFYPTMTSYANVVAPPGTETTVQGLVGAIFEGVGTALGSFIGGLLYERYGGWNTFRWFGFGSLAFCVLHVLVQYLLRGSTTHIGVPKGYDSVIRYEHPNDTVCIIGDAVAADDDS